MKNAALTLDPSMPPGEMVSAALGKEREYFLLPIKIKLAIAGLLVLVPRIAGDTHFKGPTADFILGWPSMLIWCGAGLMCVFVLYHLLNHRTRAFLSKPVSATTTQTLSAALPVEWVKHLNHLIQQRPEKVLRVEDLVNWSIPSGEASQVDAHAVEKTQ